MNIHKVRPADSTTEATNQNVKQVDDKRTSVYAIERVPRQTSCVQPLDLEPHWTSKTVQSRNSRTFQHSGVIPNRNGGISSSFRIKFCSLSLLSQRYMIRRTIQAELFAEDTKKRSCRTKTPSPAAMLPFLFVGRVCLGGVSFNFFVYLCILNYLCRNHTPESDNKCK